MLNLAFMFLSTLLAQISTDYHFLEACGESSLLILRTGLPSDILCVSGLTERSIWSMREFDKSTVGLWGLGDYCGIYRWFCGCPSSTVTFPVILKLLITLVGSSSSESWTILFEHRISMRLHPWSLAWPSSVFSMVEQELSLMTIVRLPIICLWDVSLLLINVLIWLGLLELIRLSFQFPLLINLFQTHPHI